MRHNLTSSCPCTGLDISRKLQEVEAPRILRQSAHEGCQPYAPAAFTSFLKEDSWYLLRSSLIRPWALVRPKGNTSDFIQNRTVDLPGVAQSLRDGRSGDRIPVGARFSASVHSGPWVCPASYAIGTGSLPGVKRLRRNDDYPLPSRTEVKERVELYLCFPFGPSWSVIGRNVASFL